MLDYVFFHREPYERFVAYTRDRGLNPVCTEDEDTFEVGLPEDMAADLGEAIEAFYDEMMALNQALFEAEEASPDEYHAAGVVVNLKDGRTVYADVNPMLLGKVMDRLTPEEFGEIVNAIVDAVESPDERTFCQRMREQE